MASKDQSNKATIKKVFVLLDSNVLLHYKPFDQINWLDLVKKELQCTEVVLYFPFALIGEIDRKKWDGAKQAKERARKIGPLIVKLAKPHVETQLKKGISLILDPRHYDDFPYEQHHLIAKSSDDQLLASLIVKRDSGEQVAIVTNDGIMQVKAQMCQIPVITPSQEDELPASDEDDRKLRELQKQVAQLQSASSDLSIMFADQSTKHAHTVNLKPDRGNLSEYMERVKGKHPIVNPYGTLFGDSSELSDYNDELETYYKNQQNFFSALVKAEEFQSRLIKLELEVVNSGKLTADDVRIRLCVSTPISIPSKIIQIPRRRPTPPEPPRSRLFDPDAIRLVMIGGFLHEEKYTNEVSVDHWQIKDSQASVVIPRVMHDQKPVALPDFWILLPKDFRSEACSIEYEVIDKNALKGANAGRLPITISVIAPDEQISFVEDDYDFENEDDDENENDEEDDDEY